MKSGSSSSISSIKSQDNPQAFINIDDNLSVDEKQAPPYNSEAMNVSQTSVSFFLNAPQSGSFEPVKLVDVSNVLDTSLDLGPISSSKRIFSSKSTNRQNPKLFISVLNGIIGIGLLFLSILILRRVGENYSYNFFIFLQPDELNFFLELVRFCVFSLWNIGVFYLISSLYIIIPFILVEFTSLGENAKFYEEIVHIMRLKPYIIAFIMGIFSVFFANKIFCEAPVVMNMGDETQPVGWQFIIRRSIIAFTCTCGIIALEKWFMQRVSIFFHHLNYRERIKENNSKMAVVMTLKKFTMSKSRSPISKTLSGLFAHITGITADYFFTGELSPSAMASSLEDYGMDHYREEAYLLATQICKAIRLESLSGSSHGKKNEHQYLREDEEDTLLSEIDSSSLVLENEDLYFIFESEKDAKEAFSFLDRDNNGNITIDELADTIISTFKERSSILKSLVENKSIINQLHYLILSLLSIVIFSIGLQIFDLPTRSITVFGSLFFGLSFVFGTIASNLLYSVIFIFISHPYDVGDSVSFDAFEEVIVHEMGLLSTTFILKDGRFVYIQNKELFQKNIFNIRRSLPQTETITLSFSIQDSSALVHDLYELKERLLKFFESNSRDFLLIDNWFLPCIESRTNMKVSIVIAHKSNFQDSSLKQIRSETFNLFLVDQLKAIGLS